MKKGRLFLLKDLGRQQTDDGWEADEKRKKVLYSFKIPSENHELFNQPPGKVTSELLGFWGFQF